MAYFKEILGDWNLCYHFSMKDLLIVDSAKLKSKIEKITVDGLDKLHVVTDFDRTLTTVDSNDQTPSTSWAVFTAVLGTSYTAERQKLFDIYRPTETDSSLDYSYRLNQMETWWKKHLDLLIQHKVHKDTVESIISSTKLNFRKDTLDLFNFINKNKIPCLIFSAGIGDLITGLLDSRNIPISENIHIISNFFSYDNAGYISGFQEKVIHSLNKNEGVIHLKKFHALVEDRPNCILFGDTLEDVHMIDGLSHDTVIKIGFLNDKINLLERFKGIYDVVIIGGQSPLYIDEILNF